MKAKNQSSSNNSGDQALLRKFNLTAVLNHLRQQSPISRAALADLTGLNKATITRLIRELMDYGFVREIGMSSSVTGRPSILLELDPLAGYIIGVRLDIDYSAVILTNFAAEVVWRSEIKHAPEDGQDLIQANMLELIRKAIENVPDNGRPILGLGLSVPGLVDVESGMLLFAPNLGWQNVPFRAWLREHFNLPIYVDNEANLAALGETYFGAARDSDYVLYINVTSGVGAGIVLHQEILTGASGIAGEVGHVTVDPLGPVCKCGNKGCWEALVSVPAIFRAIRERISAGEPSTLSDQMLAHFSRLSVPVVAEAALNNDPVASAVLRETSTNFGLGLANLINILNPERVVLGGYLSPAYPVMLEEIKRVVKARALRWAWESTDITVAHLGSDASLMGAIATIYNHVLSSPIETLALSAKAEK